MHVEKDIYTILPSVSQKDDRSPALIVARHPGAANCLAPVARLLSNKGSDVYFKTLDQGEIIINSKFPNRQEIEASSLPENLSWTLISSDTPADFEIEALMKTSRLGLHSKLGIVEDYPGSVNGLIQNLIEQGLLPNLLLTTTRNQADIYRRKYPELARCPIIPIGQPSFDSLLHEDTLSESMFARERLEIPNDMKLITYIGLPAQDIPNDKADFKPFDDLNSCVLANIAKSMVEMASIYPQKHFCLINRPHPREIDELWIHPELTKIQNLPGNLEFISPSRTDWQKMGLTTRQVCCASDLVITVASTVGQEAALSGARPNNKTKLGSLALHIFPKDVMDFLLPDGFPLGEMGATGFTQTFDATQDEIEKCLFDETYQKQIAEGQKGLLRDYRFKSGATSRVPLWMRAVDKIK